MILNMCLTAHHIIAVTLVLLDGRESAPVLGMFLCYLKDVMTLVHNEHGDFWP